MIINNIEEWSNINTVLTCRIDGILHREEWIPVLNYLDRYEISNFGRVKSLSRLIKSKLNSYRTSKDTLLKCTLDGGYVKVTLHNNKVKRKFGVHQLVAQGFLTHKINKLVKVVHHLDNNPGNILVWNLEVTSQRNNCHTHSKSSSEFKGVYWSVDKSLWASRVYSSGKCIHLGYFTDEKVASNYYVSAVECIENSTPELIVCKEVLTSSDYLGVTKLSGHEKWKASINTGKEVIYLGTFTAEEEANKSYQNALLCIANDKPHEIISNARIPTSKYLGVTYDKKNKKWVASIRKKHIGRYLTEELAYKATISYVQLNSHH